ncbi:hypothetical protein [Kordiimonas marina]|uniref:hypothetical protein n=1 Tax=Kordiimonas marina TaxID=2872312 RepID=UPI001FF5898A|nr:hypothetical protein [Kordiimonas marina]MCJ9428068.1 hypothetical protein [Kordiimonas marina]
MPTISASQENVSKKEIVIDLKEPQEVRRLDDAEFIQWEARAALEELLTERIKTAVDANQKAGNKSLIDDRQHNAILISGPRGSGKTTFTLNVLEALRIDAGLGIGKDKGLNGLAILDPIDPTLISSRENFLIVIVSQVCKRVDGFIKGEARDDARYEDWKKYQRSLARGLKLLDGVGSPALYGTEWDDDVFIMETGLANASNSIDLEKSFNQFLQKSLELLGKTIFVLSIDDVDTDFARGWPVLETLRRYVATPFLVPILSGDLRLYTMAVRSRQWTNFSQKQLKHDGQVNVLAMVNHLEDQYLQKILKPENRIDLKSVAALLDDRGKDRSVKVKISTSAQPEPLPALVDDMLASLTGIRKGRELQLLRRVVAEQPLRAFLQLLHGYADSEPNGLRAFVAQSLTSIFVGPLNRIGVDRASLSLDDPSSVARQFASIIVARADHFPDGPFMASTGDDDDIRTAQLVFISALYLSGEKARDRGLGVMLRIASLATIQEVHIGDDFKASVDFFGATGLNSASHVAERLVSIFHVMGRDVSTPNRFRPSHLAIPLYRDKSKGTVNESVQLLYGKRAPSTVITSNYKKLGSDALLNLSAQKMMKNYLDFRQGYESNWPLCLTPSNLYDRLGPLAKLPIMEFMMNNGESAYVASPLRLIGLMAELLSHSAHTSDIARLLDEHTERPAIAGFQVKDDRSSASIALDSRAQNDDNNDDGDESELNSKAQEFGNGITIFESLVKQLSKWRNSVDAIELSVSPLLWGRIWTRYVATSRNIVERIPNSHYFLGNLMHRQIVAFLHAILTEEMLANDTEAWPNVIRRNPIQTDQQFTQNLRIFTAPRRGKGLDHSNLPLTQLVLGCPLWWPFLKFDAEAEKLYKSKSIAPNYDPGQWQFKLLGADSEAASVGKDASQVDQLGQGISLVDLLNAVTIQGKTMPSAKTNSSNKQANQEEEVVAKDEQKRKHEVEIQTDSETATDS